MEGVHFPGFAMFGKLKYKAPFKVLEGNMSRWSLSVLKPLSLEVFSKEKQKFPKMIFKFHR